MKLLEEDLDTVTRSCYLLRMAKNTQINTANFVAGVQTPTEEGIFEVITDECIDCGDDFRRGESLTPDGHCSHCSAVNAGQWTEVDWD